jgi:hypothetical protein
MRERRNMKEIKEESIQSGEMEGKRIKAKKGKRA